MNAGAPPGSGSTPGSTPVASPCVSVCHMDDASGWCAGCLRTLDEIAFWSVLDDEDKRAVLAELPQRRVLWAQRHPAPPGTSR